MMTAHTPGAWHPRHGKPWISDTRPTGGPPVPSVAVNLVTGERRAFNAIRGVVDAGRALERDLAELRALHVHLEHSFDEDDCFGPCKGCGKFVEQLMDERYCDGRPAAVTTVVNPPIVEGAPVLRCGHCEGGAAVLRMGAKFMACCNDDDCSIGTPLCDTIDEAVKRWHRRPAAIAKAEAR